MELTRAEAGRIRRFDGKVAIVTGAAQGIGAAVAERLASEGATLVLADVQPDVLKSSAAHLDSVRTAIFAGDVSREETGQAIVDLAVERFGKVDLLVNNAAVLGPLATIRELQLKDLQQVLSVNLFGMFIVMQAVLRCLSAQGTGGSIVNMASLSAIRANPMRAAYNVSKAGVVSLTRTAAVEVAAEGIRVNAIIPTAVETPMSKIVDQTRDLQGSRMSVSSRPIARKARPEEIASMATYLLSDEASFCTGGLYHVDGGAYA